MLKKKALSLVVLICVFMTILSACTLPHTRRVEFYINHPPRGWYRFVDPGLNYAVWLPEDWELILDDPSDDFGIPTYYQLRGNEKTGDMGIDVIDPVNFQENYCDPLMSKCGDPPTETYNIEVGGISIPCARYAYGTYSCTHLCVIGRYSIQRFYPQLSDQQISFLLSFLTTNELEKQLEPEWKQIVMSFMLEQPPDIKQEWK